MGIFDIRPTSLRLAMAASEDEEHPSLDNLVLLVFGAVLEVVCVALPGYLVARAGHLDAGQQKLLANLNVMLFTPCLGSMPYPLPMTSSADHSQSSPSSHHS